MHKIIANHYRLYFVYTRNIYVYKMIMKLTFWHLFAGCNARVLFQADAPQPKWEEMVESFWTYVAELNTQADGVVQNIKTSQLSRELE